MVSLQICCAFLTQAILQKMADPISEDALVKRQMIAQGIPGSGNRKCHHVVISIQWLGENVVSFHTIAVDTRPTIALHEELHRS